MKIKILILLLVSIIILSSCSTKENKMVIVDDSRSNADERLEQLIEALKNGDKDGVELLFSEKALDESVGFEENLDKLFEYFQGDIKEWNRDRFSSNGSIRDGKKSECLVSWYSVGTNQESYMFFMVDYTKDTINPENEGLYTLRVILSEDEATEFGYVEDMTIPGIYIPEGE